MKQILLLSITILCLPIFCFGEGAGLYEVGSSHPYATIAEALAQLNIDQSDTPFTATQTIEVDSGTYTEIPVSWGSLVPTEQYRLIIKSKTQGNAVITSSVFESVDISYLTIDGFKF